MILRKYRPEDLEEIATLFYETVHTVNARDYTPEQLSAWATGTIDKKAWNASLMAHTSIVAEEDGQIIGFGDVDDTGYLDRLYVHKDFQRRGIGRAICDALESAVQTGTITTYASLTARPFFEAMGYVVQEEHRVYRQGIVLMNDRMEKRRR